MHLLKHSGLELPVYAEDEVAWTSDEIELAAQAGESHFIRRAALRYDDYDRDDDSLKSVLHLADFVLANVCEILRVEKVDHEWGLAPMSQQTRDRLDPPDLYDSSEHELLPPGYGLVARVSVVADAQRLSQPQRKSLTYKIRHRYMNTGINPAPAYHYDLLPLSNNQFVVDPTKADPNNRKLMQGIVLVDTEPRLVEDYDDIRGL